MPAGSRAIKYFYDFLQTSSYGGNCILSGGQGGEAQRGKEHLSLSLLHLEMPLRSFSAGEKKEQLPPERPEVPQAEQREIRNAEENADSKLEGKPCPCSACQVYPLGFPFISLVARHTHALPTAMVLQKKEQKRQGCAARPGHLALMQS